MILPLFLALVACPRAPQEGWQPLIQGRSMPGWTSHGTASFKWRDGLLTATSRDRTLSWLVYEHPFGDFQLEVEFKAIRGNSGIQFRSRHPSGRPMVGLQVEIDADPQGASGGLYDQSRRGWLQAPSKEASEGFQAREWNRLRVRCQGDHVQTWLNDRLAADFRDSAALEGVLALQVFGAGTEVHFRNLRILDLGRSRWRTLFNGENMTGWRPVGGGRWELKDGVLLGLHEKKDPDYGHLVFEEVLGDFTARVRFRARMGNSGLYFRAEEAGASGMSGMQAEIDPRRRTGGLYETNGRQWIIIPNAEDLEAWFRAGKWNLLTVSAHGPNLHVALNGRQTAALFDDKGRKSGRLALQLHGSEDVFLEVAEVEILEKDRSLQVLPSTQEFKDSRLESVVTLEGVHPWYPTSDSESWQKRSQELRRQILVAAGLWPEPPRMAVEAKIHGMVVRQGYTVEKVYFQSLPGHYVTGNLYRPIGPPGKKPGILSPHGHWTHGRFLQRTKADAEKEIAAGAEKFLTNARYPLQARCAQLARMGCIVFHYDMVGYGDSQALSHGAGFEDAAAGLRGQSAFGLQTLNSIRALDFLEALPDVDPDRLGVTGASGGGTQSFILAAIDPRIQAAFPAVMVSADMQGGCVCENAHHLRVDTSNIELAALIAPRPLGLTGANDWTLHLEERGIPQLKALYQALGVPENFEAWVHPEFGHNYNQVSREHLYAFMNRHLHLGLPEPVEESSIEPILPGDLSVFDESEHSVPKDSITASGVRTVLEAWSNQQLNRLSPRTQADWETFQSVIGGALKSMLHTRLPEPGTIETQDLGKENRDGFQFQKLVLRRVGYQEVIPAALLMPEEWNGRLIVAASPGGKEDFFRFRQRTILDVKPILETGTALLMPDLFLTGELADSAPQLPIDSARHSRYDGYSYGYNRTLMAHRVHDLLICLAFARDLPGVHRVDLFGRNQFGLVALLARGLAGDAVNKTLVHWPMDFRDVQSTNDPSYLPGAVRYGDVTAFAALCAPHPLRLISDRSLPNLCQETYLAANHPLEIGVFRNQDWAEARTWFHLPN
ncbi:MAG: DUF1080 domain-containing protein [Planctomycetota bacterium]|nr:MAG: DUF1080 domain-containing protein [Planctomycetota bacterium]